MPRSHPATLPVAVYCLNKSSLKSKAAIGRTLSIKSLVRIFSIVFQIVWRLLNGGGGVIICFSHTHELKK